MVDFVNASLGAGFGGGFSLLIDKVIQGLEFVSHCQEQCRDLRMSLDALRPLLVQIHKSEDLATKKWKDEFQAFVQEADELLETCNSDSSRIWSQVNILRCGRKILKLRDCINEKVSQSSMVLLALKSAPDMTKSSQGSFFMQHVPPKIFGMEGHLKRLKSSILEVHATQSYGCVGIQGMGGAGKTLLAQMVNNDQEIQQAFGKASIFWITVGRDASIPSVYMQMREYLQVPTDNGVSLEDQRRRLMNEFSARKVLLILDDVWDATYEYKEMIDWLNIATGPGSVTLITTRIESITRRVHAKIQVALLLSEQQSWELFCTHAFGKTSSPPELEKLAESVCRECKQLPLALKVIGVAMEGKHDAAEWRSTLRHLRNSNAMVYKSVDEQLFKRLQISYDQLDEPTKICFLYFAAFPEDCTLRVKQLYLIWVAEGIFGEDLDEKHALDEAQCALNELKRRSLIEDCSFSGDDQGVKMHDVLRDLAMHLTRGAIESERDSVFMLDTKVLEKSPNSWLGLALKAKRMSLLNIKAFPNNLEAPSLKTCLLSFQGRSRSGNSTESSLQECIIVDTFFENMGNLRYLHFGPNRSLKKLPKKIGELRLLQHLNLHYCLALEELPNTIDGLKRLQSLNLRKCEALKKLPKTIGELKFLQDLNLRQCRSLEELPQDIGRLKFLQCLNLQQCRLLKELPQNIEELESLQYLNLSSCTSLSKLPKNIGRLDYLQHIDLHGCIQLEELPSSIGELKYLQHCDLHGCLQLKELPDTIGALTYLQYLNVSLCKSLMKLPKSIGRLKKLRYLHLNDCIVLIELPMDIEGLELLQHLDLHGCSTLKELPKNIGALSFLQHFDLHGCCALKELPNSIGRLELLEYLDLQGCGQLKSLPKTIKGLNSLQHFNLQGYAWEDFSYILGSMKYLHYLDISECRALQELPKSIGGLKFLQHVTLRRCRALKELPENIEGLESLQHLDLRYCSSLVGLPKNIGGLKHLQYLDLSHCYALKELPTTIGELESLQCLNLRWCRLLKELPASIGGLKFLRYLNLSRCKLLEL